MPRVRGFLTTRRERPLRLWLLIAAAATAFVLFAALAYVLLLPPRAFPTGEVIHVPEDAGVRGIAAHLHTSGVIRSPLAFYAYTRLRGTDRDLAAGPYVFESPVGMANVAGRLARGEHGIAAERITLTEGMTAADMARTIGEAIPSFDRDAFLELAEESEGYLFPDTYEFLPDVTPQEAYARLRARFDERIGTLAAEIESSGRSAEDIVVMASLLEREANTFEDMQLVAGILWNRIDEGMRLQVDAVFGYIHGKNGYTPTAADLALDSPYNTYLYEGFPPGPISNPGLDALRAAAAPAETDYLYYLTGVDGNMYYGRTFDEHRQNRMRYLDI